MDPMRLALLLIFAFAVSSQAPPLAADASQSREVKYVDAAGAARVLRSDPELVVLDIRTPREFGAGRIKGAKNVDFYADDFAANLTKLETDKTYLVHCASGGRSAKALALFRELGFRSVIHMDGGFNEWERTRLPVER